MSFEADLAALFDRLDARLRRDFAAVKDANGHARAEDCDRVLARHAAFLNRFFDRWVARVRRRNPAIADALQRELEPVRALMQKNARDLVRPH